MEYASDILLVAVIIALVSIAIDILKSLIR
jgi:hypothetical protein